MSQGRLAAFTELAQQVAAAQLGGSVEPWQARAATVLADTLVRVFGHPTAPVDWWEHGLAAGTWLTGVVFSLDPSSVECPEA